MSIPEIYLVEPYNAYTHQQGGRKKHWMEVVEEQALMQKIIADQIALQEAQSRTLPPDSPSISTPAVGNNAAGAGIPVWDFWSATKDTVNFDRTPSTGDGPLTVTFTNLTTTPQFDLYNWYFGDGTTSNEVNPIHVYGTSSDATNVWTASLQVSNSITLAPGGKSPDVYISASIPTVVADFTFTTSSNVAPFTAAFINTSTNSSQTPTTTYLWTFINGNTTTTSSATSPMLVVHSGSLTASLQTTGSYNIADIKTTMFDAAAPTLNISFTVTTSSNYSPAVVTLTPTITYNGVGTTSGNWYSGEWTEGGTQYTLPYAGAWTNRVYDTRSGASTTDGKFTASLQITESIYGIARRYTQSFALTFPTLNVSFVTRSFGFGGAENSYMEPVSMSYTSSIVYDGNGSFTFLWDFGSASFYTTTLGEQTSGSIYQGPHFRADYVPGGYTASFQVTESSYGLAGRYTQSFTVNT